MSHIYVYIVVKASSVKFKFETKTSLQNGLQTFARIASKINLLLDSIVHGQLKQTIQQIVQTYLSAIIVSHKVYTKILRSIL